MKKIALALMAALLLSLASSCTLPEASLPLSPSDNGYGESLSINSDPTNKESEKDALASYTESTQNDEHAAFEATIRSTPTKDGYVFAGWYSDERLTDYIDPDGITDAQYAAATAYAKWIDPQTASFLLRDHAVTITDSGRINQQMDMVDLTYGAPYTMEDLRRAGYSAVQISVSMGITEVNDGYQYVFLYSDSTCQSPDSSLIDLYDRYILGQQPEEDPSLLYMYRYEHGAGVKDTSWGTLSFTVTLSTAHIPSNLYIRYGASGVYEDTWQNTDVTVSVTPML